MPSSSSTILKTISLSESGSSSSSSSSSITISAEVYVSRLTDPKLLNNNNKSPSTFLLLPFWGGTAGTYSTVQRDLLRECPGNASIAVNYKGTGKAFLDIDSTDDDPTRHSTKMLAQDVLRLLQSAQLAEVVDVSNLIVCAHSMSAKVALQLASILSAEDSHLCLQSMLLLGPAPPLPLTLPPELRSGQLTAYDSVESATWAIQNVLASTELDDRSVGRLVEDCVRMSRGAKKGWIEVGMAESLETMLRNASDNLRQVPIRVLAGAHDKVETFEKVKSETVAILRSYGLNVALIELENSGHLIPVERPDAVVRELVSLAQKS